MAYFSFSLLKESFSYSSQQLKLNLKYYSKDITLWKRLNNQNKHFTFCNLKREKRLKTNTIGKKLLICLPPKYGVGDAVEYSIALKSLISSNKFEKIAIAYCGKHEYVFKNFFLIKNVYPVIIPDDEVKKYDTVFHVTLEVEALKFQKYSRSNIAFEICKHFNVKLVNYKIKNNNFLKNNKTISIFPVSTSVIRSLSNNVIDQLLEILKKEFIFKFIIDDSSFSTYLEKKIKEKHKETNIEFIKPRNIKELINEVSKINFGVFVDSGPLHIAKIFDKKGIFLETSVSKDILLSNSNKIYTVKNFYRSDYCSGPCGLVDIFSHNTVGCYETNKTSFEKIKNIEMLKNIQRFNKKDYIEHFIHNPVGCVKNISVNDIVKLIKAKLKE